MVVAAIANGGEVMAPYLVKEIQSQELDTVETTEPDRLGRADRLAVAATLTEMMVNNENSYGGGGKITGVQIAAKTGTAEHGATPKTTPPHVWYVAFAPAERPRWRWPCSSSPAATAATWPPPAAPSPRRSAGP